MANTTISSLPTGATLAGTELVPIVQSGVTVKATVSAIAGMAATGATGAVGATGATGGIGATGAQGSTGGPTGTFIQMAAAPTTGDVPDGTWIVWNNTNDGSISIYANKSGSLFVIPFMLI